MDYYYIAGIAVAVISVAIAVVKKAKNKAILTNVREVMKVTREKLDDNKITKKEFVEIAMTALDVFL